MLNSSPDYQRFLTALMATRTILCELRPLLLPAPRSQAPARLPSGADVGFSFADDYLNEMRSAVMSMVRYGEAGANGKVFEPLACACTRCLVAQLCT